MYIPLFLAFGVVVHLVLLYSIFDVYYSSPLVKGARSHPITKAGLGPASRLVLFSADGLRSSTFFEHPEKSSYLHGLIRNGKSSWGISKSHVPTESRPGHVALMAGFYEDVSAVAMGWKHNPVPFDSTLNQSSKVWMWGSPDITSLFEDTLAPSVLVLSDSYSSQEEDFASKDAARLDEWVFDKVEAYFSAVNKEGSMEKKSVIRSPKSIFFLHLIGLDTNGHGHKPRSSKYIDNIARVDSGVKKMVELFESTFKDNRGSHGAGTDDEILTPFVTWGAGIQPNAIKQTLNQVDLAPLQSALLGLAVPVNSMGVLPVQLLSASPKYKFQAAYGNLKQMTEQYSIRRGERLNNSLPLLFREYPGFQAGALDRVEAEILRLADGRRYDAAANACLQWVPRVRDALLYFHRYQRQSLGLAITALYISWNVAVYSLVTRNRSKPSLRARDVFPSNACFSAVLGLVTFLAWVQHLPWMNFAYYLMPVYTTSLVYNINVGNKCQGVGNKPKDRSSMTRLVEYATRVIDGSERDYLVGLRTYAPLLLGGCLIGALLLTTFVSVFFERSVLSIMFVCLAPIWSVNKWEANERTKWPLLWIASCLALAIFPQLDTVGGTPHPVLVVLAPIASSVALGLYSCYTKPRNGFYTTFTCLISLHLLSALLNGYALLVIHWGYKEVPLVTRLFSWISIPLSFLLPMTANTPRSIGDTLVIWLAALFLPFSTLSIAYESMFLLIFSLFLVSFVRLEMFASGVVREEEFFGKGSFGMKKLKKDDQVNGLETSNSFARISAEGPSHFTLAEWRRAILLVGMIEMAFFGTGNIASLNSFNPTFLRNFTTLFSPFLMASLLLFKISIPFLHLAISFALILQHQPRMLPRLSVLMMLITDSMAVVFFYCLKDEGSWLEIGLSISNYVISLLSSIIVFVLLHLAGKLLLVEFDLVGGWRMFLRYVATCSKNK